jgi:hypothetical protein
VTTVPAVPSTVNRTKPTRFWPKSSTVRPEGVTITSWTGSSCVRRTGGPARATSAPTVGAKISTGFHEESSNAFVHHASSRRRASNDSPL